MVNRRVRRRNRRIARAKLPAKTVATPGSPAMILQEASSPSSKLNIVVQMWMGELRSVSPPRLEALNVTSLTREVLHTLQMTPFNTLTGFPILHSKSGQTKGSMLTSRDLVCKGYGPAEGLIGEILDKMFDAASKTYAYAAERMEEARKCLKITTRTIVRKVKTVTAKFASAAKPTVDRTVSGVKSVMVKLRPHVDLAYSWVKSTATSFVNAVIAVAT